MSLGYYSNFDFDELKAFEPKLQKATKAELIEIAVRALNIEAGQAGGQHRFDEHLKKDPVGTLKYIADRLNQT